MAQAPRRRGEAMPLPPTPPEGGPDDLDYVYRTPGELQSVQPYYGLPLMTPEMRRYRVGGPQMTDPRQFEYMRRKREEARTQGTRLKKGGEVKGGKNWIQGAIKKPGALREQMGVKAGQKIPAKKLAAAAKAPGKLGQRARFAQTLAKMKRK